MSDAPTGESSARHPVPRPETTGGHPAAEKQSYETATARLEQIIKRLDSGEAGLRETLDLCAEGRELVEYCAGELDAVGQGLQQLRLEELVARLEATGAGTGAGPAGDRQ